MRSLKDSKKLSILAAWRPEQEGHSGFSYGEMMSLPKKRRLKGIVLFDKSEDQITELKSKNGGRQCLFDGLSVIILSAQQNNSRIGVISECTKSSDG